MPTLQEALHTFLQEDRSAYTAKQYRLVLSRLVTAIGPQRSVVLIRYEDLMDYISRLRADGLKPTTITGYIAIFKTFFAWCVRRGYVETSPAADIKRRAAVRDPNLNRAVPPDELARMVEYALLTSPRNYALLLFLIDTGCRVGGLISLTVANLDLEAMTAVILEKGERWHKVMYGDETAAALRVWLGKRPAVRHDYVWTGLGPKYEPLTRAGVGAIVRRLAEKVEASRSWSPHAIRHAVGHAYARAGIPVTITQSKLGHSTPSVTMQHYYPHDDVYLQQISRRYALLALRQETPSTGAAPQLVKKPRKDTG